MTEGSPVLATPCIALVGNTSWYLYKFRGGTIRALRQRRARVICIAPRDGTSARLAEELEAEYIPYGLERDGYNPFRELHSILQLILILNRTRPDFVFNFTIKANIYSGIACRLLRVPYANNITGLGLVIDSGSLLARLAERLYRLANRGAARVFVQNPDDLALMRRKGWLDRTPVTEIMGSGVDLERFRTQPPAPSPLTFLFIGRLQGNKGVREFVAAAREIRVRHPDTRFVLLGSNQYANRTAITDQELSLWREEGIVEIAGQADDVRPWLTQCHALVLPSYGGEGVPRVILEAAACARPSIVSDVPGCRHAVIDGVTGFICPSRDSAALADRMEKFAALSVQDRNAMGQAARARAEERFSEQDVINAYLDCLRKPESKQAGLTWHGWQS